MSKQWFAVCYCAELRSGDAREPLNGTCYIGQVVREGVSVEKLVEKRAKEHLATSKWKPKDVGVMAAMRIFGPNSFAWSVIGYKTNATEEALTEWANRTEVAEIAKRGGTLQDMSPSSFLKQTFNLQVGGQSALSRCNLAAFHTRSWKKFQEALQLYVSCFGSACVPCEYKSPSGYPLGFTVRSVRIGVMLNGKRDKAERVQFLESLPGWLWDARDSKERKEAIGKASKERYWDNYESFRTKRRENARLRHEEKIASEPDPRKKIVLEKRMNKAFRDSDARTAKRNASKQ